MFIHAGALMDAKTPNQIIGVIAHESGHITGGHLARLRNQISKAKSAALMLQLLGLAAMAAGAVAAPARLGNSAWAQPTAEPTPRCAWCLPTGRTKSPRPTRPPSPFSMPPTNPHVDCSRPWSS